MTSDDLLMTSDCGGTSVRRHVFSIRNVVGPAVHACAHHGARSPQVRRHVFSIRAVVGPAVHACAHYGARSPQVRRHVFSLEALEEGRAAFANETVHAQV
jgi:hypothetical protein